MARKHHYLDGDVDVITIANATGSSPWSWSPAANRVFLLTALYLDFETDDDANPDRYPGIKYVVSSKIVSARRSVLAQAPNLTYGFSPHIGGNLVSANSTIHCFSLPIIKVDSDFTISDYTAGLQNADAFNNIRLAVVEWHK